MSRFLRFCAFLSALFLTTNVFATGYTCPTVRQYTSCATNYYVSDCGTTFNGRTLTTDDLTANNSCIQCPSNYTCSGGLVCPRPSQVTIRYVTGNTTLGQSQAISGFASSLIELSRMSNGVPAALKNPNYGWTFEGWATAPNVNTVTYTDGQSVAFTSNQVLYAVWGRTITVKYYVGSAATSLTTRTDLTQYYLNTSTTAAGVTSYTRPRLYASSDSTIGWTPIGWSYGTSTEPNITSNITSSGTAANPVDVSPELNAVYTRSAAVTYNGNENTGGSTSSTGYTQLFNAANGAADSVSVTLASNGFTKTGYTFSKWAAGSTGGTQYAAGATFAPKNTAWNSTISYPMFAIWAGVQSTVSFDANDGSGGQSANVTATYGNAMPSISTTAPTRDGYTFMGWYDNATYTAGTQYYTAAGASARTWDKTANTTLYAGWKANEYTVSFNANGGSGGQSADVTATYDNAMPSISTTAPTRTGYTFMGWYDNATYTSGTQYYTAAGASARTWNKTANTTLYAGWKANTFPVSYSGNENTGGRAPTSPTSCTYGAACTAPSNTYTKTGYRFTGWQCTGGTTACDGDIIAAGGSLKNVSTGAGITLTAQWAPNSYTVVFKTGNTNMGSQDFTYGVSQQLTAVSTMSNIPVTGWTFAGWSTGADSTAEYTDAQSVSNLTTTHGGTVVLYGVWTRDVTFKYYNGATATAVTTSKRTQSYYNTSATAAGTNAVSTYPIVTQTGDNKWAPYGWALNSYTTTDTVSTATTTPANVNPGIDTSNPVYTALYRRTYTITYDGNNATSGSTADTTGTQYFNSGSSSANSLKLTLAQNGFTKTGYGFSKWADLLAVTPIEYAAGATYTVLNQNRTWASTPLTIMFAIWGAQQYEITLDQNGATKNATTTKLYTKYNTGVYSDSERTTAMTTSSKVDLPHRQFTVTFNANGGSVSTGSAIANSTFNGYWSATSGGTQYINVSGTMLDAGLTAGKGYTANKTWYARWIPGSVSLPTPTRTGYTFAGWATSCDATSVLSSPYTPTADVTLCATWSANMTGGIILNSQYYASSSASTGTIVTTSAAPTPIYIKYNTGVYDSSLANATAITKLTTPPEYTGYTFQGFYTDKAGTGDQVIDKDGNFLSDRVNKLYPDAGATATWYAHYTANCNMVLLNANGGTAGLLTRLYKRSGSGAWYTNAACTTSYAGSSTVKPTREGFTFRGFYTEDLTDVSVDVAESTDIRMIGSLGGPTTVGNSWKITGTETLYAAWARNCDAGTKATCSLDVADGVDYTTGCDTGWHITSGVNTYAPVCMANTYYIQYDSNADAAMGTPSWTGFKKLTYTYDTPSYLEEAAVLWSGSIDYTYDGKLYSFVGWSRTPGATTPDSDLETPSDTSIKKAWNLTTTNGATVYLYAVWSSCLTCLVETGAACDLVDAITCEYETSCLPGYKEKSGAGTYNPKCDPIDYQIKYNANCDGATGTMVNTVLDYNDKVNLTINGFTCGTKKFLGWADVNGCTVTIDGDRTCTVVYTQGQEVEKLATNDGAVVQLFAVWGDCMECMENTPGASCIQTAPLGVCTYRTACLEGYNTLVNGGTTYPSCSANKYTVKYNMNCPSGTTCSSAPSDTTCTYDENCVFRDIQSTSLYAGGYMLTGWASDTTTSPGSIAGRNLTTTNNGTVTQYAIWSKCAAGTYHPASTGTAANVCTNAADGKFVAAAGATADVACAQGSYSEKSSASTKCVACPAGRTTSGTGTRYNATANTACAVTCSNNTGVYAWATPSWSDNTVANLCTVTSCSSTYYKNSNACALCSGLANKFYPNSNDGNSSGASACFTNELSGQYVKSANAAAATDCTNWTYRPAHTVNYGSTSTCAPCAAVPSAVNGVAWTKASGTKWTSYDQCVVTQTPAGCASGTVKRTQTGTNAWGGTKLASTLRSKDGFFADADATACTAADDGYYAKAGATSQTACAQGSYSTKSSESSTCTACPAGRTTSGTGTKYNATANTACAVTCSNNAGVYEWATPSWSANSVANLCTVSKCNANTYYTATTASGYKNTCTSCGSNSSTSAGNTSTTCTCTAGYTAGSNAGSVDGDATTKSSACKLISDITCASGEYVPAKATSCSACTAGYYCPSSAKTYSYSSSIQGRDPCAEGTYQPDTGKTSCLSADKGYYVSGTAKTEQTPCTGATYQNATGQTSCKNCPSGYTANTTSAKTAQSQCQISCAKGTQVATANAQCTTPSGNWYTTASQLVNYGSTSSVNACEVATNLFNPSDYDVFWGWVNSSNEIRSYATNAFVYIPVEPNTTYIVSGMGDATTTSGRAVYDMAATPVAGGTVLQRVLAGAKGKGMMITTGATAKYLGVFVLSDSDSASTSTREAKVQANVANLQIFKASDGYGITGNATTDHDAASDCKITCGAGQYVATGGSACVNVGAGYYATGGTVAQGGTSSRSQCTSPLTTIGYGTAANEAADCGRKLHMGDNVVYLRSDKRTTPSLRVKVGGTTFYGALSTSLSSAMKVKNGSTEYSVVNDYQ